MKLSLFLIRKWFNFCNPAHNHNYAIKMKKLIVCIITVLLSLAAFSGDLPAELTNAIGSGNATIISTYFNTTLEITILEKEGVYSKTQAEMIVKDFFVQHPPKQFSLLHQGGKESSKFAIGNLVSGSQTFRVTIIFKTDGTELIINQFRIEYEYVE
jgi:hypothetical protein